MKDSRKRLLAWTGNTANAKSSWRISKKANYALRTICSRRYFGDFRPCDVASDLRLKYPSGAGS